MEDKLVASVKKALDVLDILAFEDVEREGMRLKRLSEMTGIKPNTLHAILKTMVRCGYVQQNSKLRYTIGKRCRQMGLFNRMKMSPRTAAVLDSALKELFETTGKSVSFYVLDHGERINYLNLTVSRPSKVDYSMLEERSMYWYPSGRILVAFCDGRELSRIIRKNGLPGEMWAGADSREALEAAADKVRRSGWAVKENPDVNGASYSLPVFYPDGSLLGALGVYLSFADKVEDTDLLRRQMQNCADQICARLCRHEG